MEIDLSDIELSEEEEQILDELIEFAEVLGTEKTLIFKDMLESMIGAFIHIKDEVEELERDRDDTRYSLNISETEVDSLKNDVSNLEREVSGLNNQIYCLEQSNGKSRW